MSASDSKHWLAEPNMKYWPQQLKFAVFCATQGHRVSREIFDSGADLPPQIKTSTSSTYISLSGGFCTS